MGLQPGGGAGEPLRRTAGPPLAVESSPWETHMKKWLVPGGVGGGALTTDTGLLVIIFQDLLTKQWYLQRLYD